MQNVLSNGDLGWARDGLNTTLGASEVVGVKLWGKHGEYGGSASEALLVERTTQAGKKIRYVVSCFLTSKESAGKYPYADLTVTFPVGDLMLRTLVELLIPAMDGVIVANNP
jgi:hypothetical protein